MTELNMNTPAREARLRRKLKSQGYKLCKTRSSVQLATGGYMILQRLDGHGLMGAAGDFPIPYSLSLEAAEDFALQEN